MPNWKLAAAVTGGALLAVSTAKAQRTVITVGGANPSFSNLPAAVAAAAPGSVLVVRPGTHDGFTTNKPLRVVLDFTAQTGSIVAPAGATYAIEVSGLSGNQEFALVGRGARIHGGALGGIRVSNTAGRVVFDGVDVDVAGAGVALDVQNAAAVLVQNSVCRGRHGLQLQDALLATSAVDWLGRGGTGGQVGYGIVATRGTIDLSLGSCEGTRGPAIRIGDSAIRMAGNGATGLRVGGTAAGPVAAFEAILSDVRWQSSRFVLQPQNGAPGFAAVGGTVTTEDVPALAATGAAPGGQLSVTASRPAPAPGAIVLGHLAARHIAFGVDAVWLDEFGPAFVIAVGAVDANGLTRQVTWPNVPWLLGEVFGCQGLVLPSGGGSLATAPAVWAAM